MPFWAGWDHSPIVFNHSNNFTLAAVLLILSKLDSSVSHGSSQVIHSVVTVSVSVRCKFCCLHLVEVRPEVVIVACVLLISVCVCVCVCV